MPSATAFPDNLKIDTLAKNAHTTKDRTQETHKDVSMPQDVTKETKSLVLEIQQAATTAEHVLFHKSRDRIDQSAIDQDQLAHVPKSTHLMVTAAFHANKVKFQTKTELAATQLQHASVPEKSLEPDRTATDATLAHQTLFQTIPELPVLDQSQSAHALRDTQLMDMNASNVQTDKSLM
jgi:hypothetical protein